MCLRTGGGDWGEAGFDIDFLGRGVGILEGERGEGSGDTVEQTVFVEDVSEGLLSSLGAGSTELLSTGR